MNRAPRPALQRTVLLDHLFALWRKLAAEPTSPHLDRWLSRELGAQGDLGGMHRPQRLWLGEQLTEGVRFATLALFAETAGVAIARALAQWQTPPPDDDDLWAQLRRLPPAAVFFWAFLRQRHDGARLPRLPEPGPESMKVWSALRARCDGTMDPQARFLWAGVPPWLTAPLARRVQASGWTTEQTRRFQDRQSSRSPLWLRINRPEHAEKIVRELRRTGFKVTEVDDALAAAGDQGIYELKCYREGLLEVQDLASQAIGRVVAAEPGHFVWDCCAGGGGKSLQIAAGMGGRGAVYATDIHEARLQDLRRRAKRASFRTIRAHRWDGESLPDFGTTVAKRGGFDRVLVDAPCTGSGTWRRNPDGRLRELATELPDLNAQQLRLLRVAVDGVKPGGRLIYATCSWLCEENEDVAAALLAERADLTLVSQGTHGNPDADADTTFTAVFVKRSEPTPPAVVST
jgi:16S rRNA (cytosine967-C5)-methyltransferase